MTLDLITPMNLINSIKTTFKRRPGKKRIYVLCMILLMFINDLPIDGEKDAEFMYVKRAFQWEVDDTSYYETLRSVGSTIGTAVAIPVLHYFNTNDNLIILISTASLVALRFTKWLAKTGDVFLASTAIGALENVFYAPTRSQITRCVSSEELGKVLYHFGMCEPILMAFIRFLPLCPASNHWPQLLQLPSTQVFITPLQNWRIHGHPLISSCQDAYSY